MQRNVLRFILFGASAAPTLGRPAATACPPSCANNELTELLDQYCSDKGTFWQSKHHYATAYHSLFGSLRESVTSILEIGIGEDTAPSVQAWATYFPKAHVYPVDIKTRKEVAERARPGGATDRLVKHQAQFGCEYNRSMWDNPRVHLTLETDASNPQQLQKVPLPAQLDIILDDGSHKYLDQQRTLHTLWPRLRPGGFYIVEDMLVGALPWDAAHAKQVPTKNFDCGVECFFPQRLEEHPFLFDRFGHLKGSHAPAVPLEARTKDLMRKHDWFWVVTGAAQELQEKLQKRQDELAARQADAEAEEKKRAKSGAGFASTASRDMPLRVLLAASVVCNILLWRRKSGGGSSLHR